MTAKDAWRRLAVPLDTPPMEALRTAELPQDDGWQFEPKWDGFRCLAFRSGGDVELKAKSGKSLSRYFPEVAALLAALPQDRFVIDGELTIAVDGALSFEALQMRLHPAESRIRKLSAQTPASYILFDCLQDAAGRSLIDAPLSRRREALEAFVEAAGSPARLQLSPYTRDLAQARAWLDNLGAELDGVVAKRVDGPYVPGERAMLKIKRIRTADCVVGGFRYAKGSSYVGSLLLGLHDAEGRLNHVGFTATISHAERAALTAKLEPLIEPPGFTGDAPGGPSRWSTERTGDWQPLRNELVVEVAYDHVSGGRFRHGTRLLRWRPDKAPRQCGCEQLKG